MLYIPTCGKLRLKIATAFFHVQFLIFYKSRKTTMHIIIYFFKVNLLKMVIFMKAINVRQKLHTFIDTIEDKRVEAIHTLFVNEVDTDSTKKKN